MHTRMKTTVAVSALTMVATFGVASPAFAGNPHSDPPGNSGSHGPGVTAESRGANGEDKKNDSPASQPAAPAPTSAAPDEQAHVAEQSAHTPAQSPSVVGDTTGNPTPGVRYPVCHATGSASNPYVSIDVALPAILNAHDHHHVQHDPDDIIPAIPGYYAGLNADSYDEACGVTTGTPGPPRNPGGELPTLSLETVQLETLPATGDDTAGIFAAAGLGLLALGGLTVAATRSSRRVNV